jgi:hypothetical protein
MRQRDLFCEPAALTMSRAWAMPSHDTFSIRPIRELIERHMHGGVWLDPFSRNSPFRGRTITNDLNPDFPADHHEEAADFLRRWPADSVDGVLFDPPYSPRQISECYKGVGREVHTIDTSSAFYGDRKRLAALAIKPGGKAICFGWNSGGLGKSNGFELVEVLIVAHGGAHNDTICTVEVKRL